MCLLCRPQVRSVATSQRWFSGLRGARKEPRHPGAGGLRRRLQGCAPEGRAESSAGCCCRWPSNSSSAAPRRCEAWTARSSTCASAAYIRTWSSSRRCAGLLGASQSSAEQEPSAAFLQVFLTQDHIAIVTDFADGGELAAQITAQTRSAPRPDMAYTEDQVTAVPGC